MEKNTKRMLRIGGISLLVIWLILGIGNFINKSVIQPALIDRENYNPLDVDEATCSELVKVENCLNAFFEDYTYQKSLDEYLWGSYVPDADKEGLQLIKDYAYSYEYYSSKATYNYYLHNPEITYEEAKEWAEILSLHKQWYAQLRVLLEYYLYKKCESQLVPKTTPASLKNVGIADEEMYVHQLQEGILKYFEGLYPPILDEAELLNDDRKDYEVWGLYKATDPEGKDPVRITVTYDRNNKRMKIRLFHSL